MDPFVDDGHEDNAESSLSHDDMDTGDGASPHMDTAKGFTFSEIGITRASSSKVVCCHFSLDGKLLATGGHDKKAVMWHADSLKLKSASGEHSSLITDVRFSPSMPRLATSSFDKTVRVWDVDSVNVARRDAYEFLKLNMPKELVENLKFSENYSSQVWLVGDGVTDDEQKKAAKGVHFIPFSQFPPKIVRKDCFYHSTPALTTPKDYENMHTCENWLPSSQVLLH